MDHVWLLAAVSANPSAGSELVMLYPDYLLCEEVAAKARLEVSLRCEPHCPGCDARLAARTVTIPELTYLRVIEQDTAKTVVEGWALDGDYMLDCEQCPECDAPRLQLEGSVSRFGCATDVVRKLRSGMHFI